MSSDDFKKLIKQNELIVSLLGRLAFKKEEIIDIITKKKQNPQNYIKGYNACNAERSITDLAKIVGVSRGTLSPILKEWEELGIIFEIEKPSGRFYKKIFPI